jgi:hypothetical protein
MKDEWPDSCSKLFLIEDGAPYAHWTGNCVFPKACVGAGAGRILCCDQQLKSHLPGSPAPSLVPKLIYPVSYYLYLVLL